MMQYVAVRFLSEPMGILSWDALRNQGYFAFDPAFLQQKIPFSPLRYPVDQLDARDVLFFTDANRQTDWPAFLRESIPGPFAQKLIQQHLSQKKRAPLSWLSMMGSRGFGALSFDPIGFPELNEVVEVDLDQVYDALKQFEQHPIKEDRLRALLRVALFTKGTHPSFVLAINDFTGDVLSGQNDVPKGYDAWTLRLDGFEFGPDNALLGLRHQLGQACGLRQATMRWMHTPRGRHLLVHRMDRNARERIHVQRASDLLLPDQKTCSDVLKGMRMLGLPYPHLEEQFKRWTFQWMVYGKLDPLNQMYFYWLPQSGWGLADAIPSEPVRLQQGVLFEHNTSTFWNEWIQLAKAQNLRNAKRMVQRMRATLISEHTIDPTPFESPQRLFLPL